MALIPLEPEPRPRSLGFLIVYNAGWFMLGAFCGEFSKWLWP